MKKILLLKGNLAKSRKIQGDLGGGLEHIKKSITMLNSGSSKLDQILTVGKAASDRVGLGYTGESSGSKTVFVPAAQVKKLEVVRKNSGTHSRTYIRTPVKKVVEKNTGSHSRICTKTPSRKWIPTCHYYKRIGHIRPY